MNGDPLPGRECDGCTVCCVALTVDDPELQKPAGYRCRHSAPGSGCTIYSTRPETCSSFQCGWRILRWVSETLRPDRSGVLIRLEPGEGAELGISLSLLTRSAIRAEGLAETVAAAVAAGRPVYLHVPGPPGYNSNRYRIDDKLQHPVAAKDKAAVLEVIRLTSRRRAPGKPVPIRFERAPSGTTRPLPP